MDDTIKVIYVYILYVLPVVDYVNKRMNMHITPLKYIACTLNIKNKIYVTGTFNMQTYYEENQCINKYNYI